MDIITAWSTLAWRSYYPPWCCGLAATQRWPRPGFERWGIRLGNILLPLFCLGMVSSGLGHFSVVNLLCYCHCIHT